MKTYLQNKLTLYFLTSFIILIVYSPSAAQNPLEKQWDYSYGGNDGDFIYRLLATPDSGFIAAGESLSNASFEKSDDNWDQSMFPTYDWWLIKCDAAGIKLWDKTFGGSNDEFLYSIINTSDGGCMAAGRTRSPADGNISQSPIGAFDVWAVKLDASGTIEWERRYGGDGNNGVGAVLELADGGFLFGAYTDAPVSGDVSEPSYGSYDFWIIRTDDAGTILWDKRYGGSNDETTSKIFQTGDGGFLLGGGSLSDISGLKTQDTYVSGKSDLWFVKIDSTGNFMWDKQLGSLENEYAVDMIPTSDQHYLLAVSTDAGIGGDKTQPTNGITDFWMLKTDTLLNATWDLSIGGSGHEDDFGNIYETAEGNYMIAGTSYSGTGFWKSEPNNGPENTWIVVVDSNGNKLWDKTILTGYTHTEKGLGIQLKDGCYLFANDGDGFTDQEKTDQSYSFDYWCIKYCDTSFQQSVPSPVSAFAVSLGEVCQKFCVDFFDSTSNNPTSWQWIFPGGTPSSSTDQNPTNICYNTPGNFDVTLITINAFGTDTLTLPGYITVYPTPAFPTITQNGNVLTCSPAISYQWQFNSIDIPGATQQNYTYTQEGLYTVLAGDSNGCTNNSSILITAIVNVMNDFSVTVFPNPAGGIFTVAINRVSALSGLTSGMLSVEIENEVGQRVFSSEENIVSGEWKKEIDLRKAGEGVYFIEIKTEGQFMRKKIVVMR